MGTSLWRERRCRVQKIGGVTTVGLSAVTSAGDISLTDPECAEKAQLASATYPTVARHKTSWVERQPLDRVDLPGFGIQPLYRTTPVVAPGDGEIDMVLTIGADEGS